MPRHSAAAVPLMMKVHHSQSSPVLILDSRGSSRQPTSDSSSSAANHPRGNSRTAVVALNAQPRPSTSAGESETKYGKLRQRQDKTFATLLAAATSGLSHPVLDAGSAKATKRKVRVRRKGKLDTNFVRTSNVKAQASSTATSTGDRSASANATSKPEQVQKVASRQTTARGRETSPHSLVRLNRYLDHRTPSLRYPTRPVTTRALTRRPKPTAVTPKRSTSRPKSAGTRIEQTASPTFRAGAAGSESSWGRLGHGAPSVEGEPQKMAFRWEPHHTQVTAASPAGKMAVTGTSPRARDTARHVAPSLKMHDANGSHEQPDQQHLAASADSYSARAGGSSETSAPVAHVSTSPTIISGHNGREGSESSSGSQKLAAFDEQEEVKQDDTQQARTQQRGADRQHRLQPSREHGDDGSVLPSSKDAERVVWLHQMVARTDREQPQVEDDFKTSFGEPDDSTFDSSSQQDRHLGSRSSAVQRVSSNAASRQAKWEALGLTKPRAGIVPLSEHPSALESANEALQAARSERRRKEARQIRESFKQRLGRGPTASQIRGGLSFLYQQNGVPGTAKRRSNDSNASTATRHERLAQSGRASGGSRTKRNNQASGSDLRLERRHQNSRQDSRRSNGKGKRGASSTRRRAGRRRGDAAPRVAGTQRFRRKPPTIVHE